MKKTTFLILMFLSAFSLLSAARSGYCDDDLVTDANTKQGLVSLDTSHTKDSIRELSSRIDDLEREKRSQDERIRNLERTVNDLRRER